jgi:hypothetical protein
MTHHLIKHYCAYKTGTKKYKYLILGDDTLDTSEVVYEYYMEVIQNLGVMISTAKCTRSNIGSGEFAKRLYRRGTEITGIPVNLLTNIVKQPENYIELVRVMRERGYNDKDIARGVSNLLSISFKKERSTISDQLALSERITGRTPLLAARVGSYVEKLNDLPFDEQSKYLQIARDKRFYLETNKISYVSETHGQKPVDRFSIHPNHPLVYAVNQKLEPFLGLDLSCSDFDDINNLGSDEFSIYNNWLKGNYRSLCRIPTIDSYKYRTRAHRITKAQYLVYQAMLELVDSKRTDDFLYYSRKVSDDSLY